MGLQWGAEWGVMDFEANVRGGWLSWGPEGHRGPWSGFQTLFFHSINIPKGDVGASATRDLSDLLRKQPRVGVWEASQGGRSDFMGKERKEDIPAQEQRCKTWGRGVDS